MHEGDAVGESPISSLSDLSLTNKRIRKRVVVEPETFASEATQVAASVTSSGVNAKHNRSLCLLCCRTKFMNKIVDQTTLVIQESKDIAGHNGKHQDPDVSFYSPESIVSDDSANTNMPDRISNTILKNVVKMANPIMFKVSRELLPHCILE